MSAQRLPCHECATAERRPWHVYIAGCRGCSARMVAAGPAFHASAQAGRQTAEYRRLLAQTGLAHEEVKAAADAARTGREVSP